MVWYGSGMVLGNGIGSIANDVYSNSVFLFLYLHLCGTIVGDVVSAL